MLTCVSVEGYLLYGVLAVGSESKWPQLEPFWDGLLNLVYLLIFLKVLIDKKSWLDWLAVIGFVGLTELTRITTQTNAVIWFTTGILLAQGIDLKRVLKIDLISRIILGIFLVAAPLIGVYPFFTLLRDSGRIRTSFGWAHPNEMGLFFLMLSILWLYFRFEKWKWTDTVLIILMVAGMDYFANSRMSELCMILLAVTALVVVFTKEKSFKVLAAADSVVLLGGCIWTLIFTTLQIEGSVWEWRLPGTIRSRQIFAHNFWMTEGFSFAGQIFDDAIHGYLDMLYAYLSLNMGMLVLIMFLVLGMIAIRGAWKQKDEKVLLILLVFSCYSLVEHEHFKMLNGFYPLLLGYYFWPFLDEIRGWIQKKLKVGGAS